MPLKNFYTATDVEPGDVLVVSIKCMVMHDGTYRLYRCPYYGREEPDGDTFISNKFYDEHDGEEDIEPRSTTQIVAEAIFPILGWCDNKPDIT